MDMLQIPFLPVPPQDDIKQISVQLDHLKRNTLEYALWQGENYKPAVQFVIGYSEGAVYLKFFVLEDELRACYTKDNTPVYLDSCVEFFIAFNNERNYYNLEFNCLGTCLA